MPTTYDHYDSDEIIEDLRAVIDNTYTSDGEKVSAIRRRLPLTIEEGTEVDATATVTYVNGSDVEIEVEIGGEAEVITIPIAAAIDAQR